MTGLGRYLPDLILVYAAFALGVASPGPSNLAVMSTAMESGRRAALFLAFGVAAGSFTWGLLAAAGLSALTAADPRLLIYLKTAGGLYLLFLGWRSARSAMRADAAAVVPAVVERRGAGRIFIRGYLMHLVNPKPVLNWTAIMALGLRPETPPAVVAAILAGCLMISLTFNSVYALAFSSEPVAAAYRRARRWIEAAVAGMFALAGLRLLTARV